MRAKAHRERVYAGRCNIGCSKKIKGDSFMSVLNDVEAMRDLLNRLKEKGGDDWAEKLAKEMTSDEYTALSEARQKPRK
jgi:hypothetical protein